MMKEKLQQIQIEQLSKKKGKVELLSGARLHEITIMLTGFPFTFVEVIDAILCMDQPSNVDDTLFEQVLTEEIVTKLLKI
jgi:hypothetical protein